MVNGAYLFFNDVFLFYFKMGLMESNFLKRLRCGLMKRERKGGIIWLMKGGIIKSKGFLSDLL